MPYLTKANLLSGVITTTTGSGLFIGDRLKLAIQYIASASAVGVSHLKIQVSNDNVNYSDYNRLISNNAAGTVFTTLNIGNVGGNGFIFFPAGDTFSYMRAKFSYDNSVHSAITVIAVGVID